jgi:thioredoxin 1
VLVAFWTPGCEPCRELRGQLSVLQTEVATLLAVNADQEPKAVAEHGVDHFPTLVFFKGGQELRRIRGGALPASTLRMLGSRSDDEGVRD